VRHPPDDAYRSVRDTDPDVLDADELATFMRRVADLKSWCDARLVRATRRQRALAADGRAADPRSSLSDHGRTSGKEAAAASSREEVCTSMPGLEDALAAGSVSAGHVDAIATATKNLDDAERSEFVGEADALLGDAAEHGVDAFTKQCRDLAKRIRARHHARSDVDEVERQRARSKVTRWIDRDTGMHKTLIEADPVTDRIIWSVVQRERGRLRLRAQDASGPRPSWDRLTVDALVEAVTVGGDDDPNRRRPTVVVHVDVERLRHDLHAHGVCETDSGIDLPADTVRYLACSADIIPVVLDGDGIALDIGRAKRLATPDQRRALEAMHATCSHPDCTVSIDDCRIHHLDPWSRGGSTDLSSLVPLCEPHHHLAHEGGWGFTMTAGRVATWTRPDGRVHWTGPIADRRPATTGTMTSAAA
jgi:Domain of unknown function (DUF222)